ncbi:MAG TPA: ketoacyl-ACP synthase III [Vicinamibacterales bacterium]
MKATFRHKRISSVVSVVPREEAAFDDEYPNYDMTPEQARRFKKMMGVDKHRVAPPEVTSSDLCLRGVEFLLEQGTLRKEDVGAMVFVSQTPDYFFPATANVLQGKLALPSDVLCLDLSQGCAGFVLGLLQSFMFLDLPGTKKVLLLNGDTASKQLSKRNRVSYPLVGDAGSVTVLESTTEERPAYFTVAMDGSRHRALMVPAGAYRKPSSEETRREVVVEDGVVRSEEHVHMDGPAVFSFTMKEVPPQIDEILEYSGETRESIDAFVFHQPNEFILTQLGDKMKIPREKLPRNIVGIYGNCSSVSIPLNLAHNYHDRLSNESLKICFSGFGVGLTWASMVMPVGPMETCQVIEY